MKKLKYNCEEYVELINIANDCIFHKEEMDKQRDVGNIDGLIFETNQYKLVKEKYRRKKNHLLFLIESNF